MAFDAEIRQALIDQVRRFVTEKCIPLENQVGETDEVPQEIVDEMKQLGLFGLAVPEAHHSGRHADGEALHANPGPLGH